MILEIDRDQLSFCCGIQEFGNFSYYNDYYNSVDSDVLPDAGDCALGSAGLACAAFIDSEDCRHAYEFLAKKHAILFQSKIYKNYSSGNNLFFVVYGKKG